MFVKIRTVRTPVSVRRRSARRFSVMGIGIVVVSLLSGCTAFFPREVTPTASAPPSEAAACSQSDAQLTWQPKQEAPLVPAGYRSVTVMPGGARSTVDTRLSYGPTVTSDDFLSPAYFEGDWINFLVGEFGRTGQSTAGSGDRKLYFDAARPANPQLGVTIIGYEFGQVSAAFDLKCQGDDVGSGVLTTVDGALHTRMIFCGDGIPDPTADNASYLTELYAHCLAP